MHDSRDRVEHLVYEQMLVAIPRLEQELARGDGGASVKELGKKVSPFMLLQYGNYVVLTML